MVMKQSTVGTPRGEEQIHTAMLSMAGRTIAMHTDSAALAEIAKNFFPFIAPDSAQPPGATVTLLVRKARDTSQAICGFPIFRGRNQYTHADYGSHGSVWFNLSAHTVFGTISDELAADAELCRRTVLSVIAGMIAPALDLIALHAGCVVRGGKAVLLAASSGVGKSTATLALAMRGWSLLSDDWTFVGHDRGQDPEALRAWGMQTSLKLLPDAVNYFPALSELSPAISLNGELSFEIDPWTFFGFSRTVQAEPVALIFLERDPHPSGASLFHIRPCTADEVRTNLLREIEEQPAEAYGVERGMASLPNRICALPAFGLRFSGHPSVIAAQLDPILREHLNA
jgi:hypothetical protein